MANVGTMIIIALARFPQLGSVASASDASGDAIAAPEVKRRHIELSVGGTGSASAAAASRGAPAGESEPPIQIIVFLRGCLKFRSKR